MATTWFIIRIICLIGCLIVLWFLASSYYRQWSTWNEKTRRHWLALCGWAFFGLYSIVESLIQGNPGGSRLIVMTLVIALTAHAIMAKGELHTGETIPWKGRNKHDS